MNIANLSNLFQFKNWFAILILSFISHMNSDIYSQQKSVTIAMAQIFCLDGDRSGNFARIENAIIEAKESGAEIVCFPETSILGWVNPEAHQRAYPIPGKDSEMMCKLAKDYNVFLCIGLAEKENEDLFDSVILIDNKGEILLKHRKRNILTELMNPPYTPGKKEISAVDTKFGKIGLLICADSFKGKILNEMKELDPAIVLIPYGWAAEENEWPEHGEELKLTVQNAAKVIGCPVIGTDLVGEISHGPWKGRTYGGCSVSADEKGTILGLCTNRDREINVFTIHL